MGIFLQRNQKMKERKFRKPGILLTDEISPWRG